VSVVDEHAYKVDLFVRPYLGMHFTAASGIERLGSETDRVTTATTMQPGSVSMRLRSERAQDGERAG